MSANSGVIRRLTCSCCGGSAGRWHQHWNRDSGFGGCVRCITAERMRGTNEDEIASLYGKEGVNWGMHAVVYGRAFRVVAAFAEHEQDRANEWMLAHPAHGLLAIHEGLALLANINDKGIEPSSNNQENNV